MLVRLRTLQRTRDYGLLIATNVRDPYLGRNNKGILMVGKYKHAKVALDSFRNE